MRNIFFLSKYFAKTLIREKIIIISVLLLPVLLVLAGAASAPDRDLPLVLDDNIITPFPPAIEISVALYALTAVVLIASLVSFFLGFNLKHLIPRLKQSAYSTSEIMISLILVMAGVNIISSIAIVFFSLIWVDVISIIGYMMGILLASIIFSTLGLIIAELVDTTTLGLYSILTLAVLDTAFLENPLYSRRYNENWISLMPTHESIQMLLRSVYDTGTAWSSNILFILGYELVLVVLYLIISLSNIGTASDLS